MAPTHAIEPATRAGGIEGGDTGPAIGMEVRSLNELRLTRRKALLSAGALALAACAPAVAPTPSPGPPGAPTPRPRAHFNWLFGFTIQANPSFPVIVAREKGFYEEQALDISWDFVTGSAGIRLIGTNQYQAGSVSDVLTVARFVTEGVPLKAVCQQGQATARAIAVKQGSGITRPRDFRGKKVGIKGGEPWTEYLAMLAHDGVDRSEVEEIPVGFSSVELVEGIVDVLPVFIGNEPFVLRTQLNTPVDLILPGDYGFPAVGTVMVANTDYLRDNRDEFIRFLRATMRGQEYMIENREEVLQMAVMYGGTATSRAAHEYIYDISAEDMKHPDGVGWLSTDAWQENIDLLVELGILETPPSLDDLVDTSFMEEILRDGRVVWPG